MADDLQRAVADVLRELAADRQWSNRDLAAAAGLNPRSVDRKLAHQSHIDVTDLAAFGRALEVDPEDLVAWGRRRI